MSLFAATINNPIRYINPKTTNIEGDIIGSYFTGRIEMTFLNETLALQYYTLIIGKNSNNSVCLHDFNIKIDTNPFVIKIMKKEEARELFEKEIQDNGCAVFGEGGDSYAQIKIPNILPNQVLTVSAEFELPVTFPTQNTIGIIFPLTCPSVKDNNTILKCSNFRFSCRFPSIKLTEKSITSNPEGKIDLLNSIYMIDHIDSNFTSISITYDPNTQSDTFSLSKGLGIFSGKYGSFTFLPTKDQTPKIDHSGEEFIFVIDCSGSMYGNEIKLASQCLLFFIKSLPKDCYFNVVCFGTKFKVLFNKPVPYTNENARIAMNLASSLKADMGGTVLSAPLSYVYSLLLSKPNKLRRIFVLTDGCVFDPDQVVDLVKRNSSTTMSSAIGIGYGVDRELVKGIGRSGKGFVDFVLSGDDMRSKVINQLDQSINGFCSVSISIEGNESIEIVPSINLSQVTVGNPATFYFKSTKELTNDNPHVCIEIEENSQPIIIELKSLPDEEKAQKSLQYLFNNENIKSLLMLKQTEEIESIITDLSVEYGILCPYTGLFGSQQYQSKEEEKRIKQLIEKCKEEMRARKKAEKEEIERKGREKNLKRRDEKMCERFNVNNIEELQALKGKYIPPNKLFCKTLTGKKIEMIIDPTKTKIKDIKDQIYEKEGLYQVQQKLIFSGEELDDESSLADYFIENESTINLVRKFKPEGFIFYGKSKEEIQELKDKYVTPNRLFVKTLIGRHVELIIDPLKTTFEDIKDQIYNLLGIPQDQQKLIYDGYELSFYDSLVDYLVPNDSIIHLVLRLRGGGFDDRTMYAARAFVDGINFDLISIVADQLVEGYWEKIPNIFSSVNNIDLTKLFNDIKNWLKKNVSAEFEDKVIATVFCLAFMCKFKKENFEMWKLIYSKGINWLKSINDSIDWDKSIRLL